MKPSRIHIIGDDYPTEEKPIGDLIKKVMAEGGYLTGWNEFQHFKPNDGEKVIVHWGDDFIDVARYRKVTDEFVVGEDMNVFCGDMRLSPKIDYWMHIPPIPEREY